MSPVTAEAQFVRREQVLSAAAHLFRQRGYHSVGIDDIGAAVGMSGPAVYRYFSTKQDLLCQVVTTYLVTLDTERDERNRRDPGTEHILDAAVAVGQRMPDYLATYHRDRLSLDPDGRTAVHALRHKVLAGWQATLAEHGVERHSDAGLLRLQAVQGVVLHLSLARADSKGRRAALAERLVADILDVPLPALGTERRGSPPQQIRHVTTREALIEVATALFQEHDFSQVSLRDIGASVGLSASAVSRQFDSKDQLMAVIFDRASAQISASIAVALRTSWTGAEAAREIVSRYAGFALDFREVIKINSTQIYALAEPQRLARIRSRRMYIDELAHALLLEQPGISTGQARLRAGAAYSLINEVVMHPRLWRLEGMSDAMVALAHAALGGRRADGLTAR